MALTDIYTTPSIKAALSTAAPATAIFGTSVDLTYPGLDIGSGDDLDITITIGTAATSGGAATLQFNFVTADDAALTSGVVVLFSTAAIPKASLVAGYKYPIYDFPEGIAYKRYIGFQQVVGTAALTAGTATCAIVRDAQNWRAYDDNIN